MAGGEPTPDSVYCVAVVNGKGGVGKTSITANLAGQMAAGGLEVLIVDLDMSADLGLAFGLDESAADGGRSIIAALEHQTPLQIQREVRPGVDMVAGGVHLAEVARLAHSWRRRTTMGATFATAIAQAAADYDIVLLDCPPSNPEIQRLALTAARFVLVPTRPDTASFKAMAKIGPIVRDVRETENPELAWLGVVLFAVPAGATRILRVSHDVLGDASSTVAVFKTTIRQSSASALEAGMRGELAHELAASAQESLKNRLRALRDKTSTRTDAHAATATSSGSLAQDYAHLASEVVDTMNRLIGGAA